MNRLFSAQPLHTDLGLLFLRLLIGGLFTWHGYNSLMHYNEYLAMSKSTIGLDAKLEFNLVVFSHLIGGILIVLGLLTRLAVIPVLITMAVAFFVAHKNDPFFQKELPFTLMLLCVVVFVLGPGRYSMDQLMQKRKPS